MKYFQVSRTLDLFSFGVFVVNLKQLYRCRNGVSYCKYCLI